MDVNKAIATTVRTGKVLYGASDAVKSAKTGKAKLCILAANCSPHIRMRIEYHCRLSGIPVIAYSGINIDLGAACGKPFPVSALTIKDSGDSDILKLAEAGNV
ncbi:MAG: 50S ribosomal protein L30e [Candidatus Bathyarchaeota archaeon]|nr:MAG: 50S ribosomal protein L30e [Candidatus Bathyarchaeota archaeon]